MDSEEQKPPIFRGRRLHEAADIYSFNTWDDVPWDAAREAAVEAAILHQLSQQPSPAPASSLAAVMDAAQSRWNWFYEHHCRWFFKDRNWLESEFAELYGPGVRSVWEVGCGAGNTVFPLVKANASVRVWACDVSDVAVGLVKGFRDFDARRITVFQWDANLADVLPVAEGSMDAITCVFILSALDPANLARLFGLFYRALRPGGVVLIRDYGHGDLAQLRLKPARLVSAAGPLVYTRGDGTAVHFFKADEFDRLAEEGGWTVRMNYVDRRLIVNRRKKLEMWRCWCQVKLQKPE